MPYANVVTMGDKEGARKPTWPPPPPETQKAQVATGEENQPTRCNRRKNYYVIYGPNHGKCHRAFGSVRQGQLPPIQQVSKTGQKRIQ